MQLEASRSSKPLQDSFVSVAAGAEGGNQFGDVVGTASLHGDVDGGVSQIHVVVGAVVGRFNDVGAMLGENAGNFMQGTGIIRKMDAQADQSPIFDQAALDNARQESYIDVSATHDYDNFLAGFLTNQGTAAID